MKTEIELLQMENEIYIEYRSALRLYAHAENESKKRKYHNELLICSARMDLIKKIIR